MYLNKNVELNVVNKIIILVKCDHVAFVVKLRLDTYSKMVIAFALQVHIIIVYTILIIRIKIAYSSAADLAYLQLASYF